MPQTIAVIENDVSMLTALNRLLTAHGFDVTGFHSAEAFLAAGVARKFACLVLDIDLDGMSGLELSRHLNHSGAALPIIFITAFDAPQPKREALNAGCVAYLIKPFAGTELIGAIRMATI